MRRVLLYKTGQTAHEVVRDVGDYIGWFNRVLDGSVTLVVHEAQPAPRGMSFAWDGVIITGSPSSLVEPEPWMEDAAGWVRDAATAGVPVLGVCFGHQLLGRAFGGAVRRSPRGWEAGTHAVELTDEGQRDPLFTGLGPRLVVNQSHRDEVATLGEGVRRLATGEHSENQALAAGDHVRGVQFHPEMSGPVIRRIIEHRRAILEGDCLEHGRPVEHHPESLLTRIKDTPDAENVVRNFVKHFAARA